MRTPGRNLLFRLTELSRLVGELTPDAAATVEWTDAPPDLLLLLALEKGAAIEPRVVEGRRVLVAEWACGQVLVRARTPIPSPGGRPKLTLVNS